MMLKGLTVGMADSKQETDFFPLFLPCSYFFGWHY